MILAVLAVALLWRPLAAWWADDAGNRALARGDAQGASVWFDRALVLEPQWRLLHEDRGRALAGPDPAAAVPEFDRAGCGAPCDAQAGDALLRLGKADAAVERYVKAHATGRVFAAARELAREGRYDDALRLVRLLIAQLHDNFLERSDLAASYAALGSLELDAATARPGLAHELRARAIADLGEAKRLSPFNEGYLLLYASAQLQFGDPRAARKAYEQVLQLHPDEADAQAALSRSHDPADGR